MASTPRNLNAPGKAPVSATVSCVLAVDGGERLAKDWPHLAVSYVTAILRQLSNIQVAPMVINSLPPTSKRPLVLRPFRPVSQAMTELPGLLGGKGKQRESTSDLDYALLEGLLVAASLLQSQQAKHSYLVLVSAQDIPNTNFWDEELPGSVPLALPWPEIGSSFDLENQQYNSSQGWQRLLQELTKAPTHFCTITTRFLPRLEDFQRKVATANNLPSQALPNLQHPEHAILLTGFQSAGSQTQSQAKRSYGDSVEESPRDSKDPVIAPAVNGQNKRVKLSPNIEARKVPLEQKPAKVHAEGPQHAREPSVGQPPPAQVTQTTPDSLYLQQSPTKILMSLASAQSGSQGPFDASSVFQPQQQQIQELAQQPFSVQDIKQKREEVKTQMKQFLTSLSSMARAKQFSMEQARVAAEQVRAEALQKLQLLDRLEQQSLNRSPSLGPQGFLAAVDGNVQQSPGAAYQQLQQMSQQNRPGYQGQNTAQANSQQAVLGQQQLQSQQNQLPVQPQQYPNQNQNAGQQSAQRYNPNQNHQQAQGQQQQQTIPPGHQRTASFSSTTSSSAYQPTPNQTFAQLQGIGPTTPTLPGQAPQLQGKNVPSKQPTSPSKSPPVWSGPIQWSLVDPQTKQKRELAFYVDAIPMRPNAAVELMNFQWPSTLEIAHITSMQMPELQKYASDNRVQVMHITRASAAVVEQQGMSLGQNDSLYRLLAKSLEDKSSVAIIKLPAAGQNRGIVIVALPGQARLVGLLFLHTNLPPRTPSGSQADQPQQQQQSMQRNNSRSQDSRQPSQPLPSPSFSQQSLQPFLQQMMQSQFQQAQQQSTPNPLYAPGFGQQHIPQFTSPSFTGATLPSSQGVDLQGLALMGSNQFSFAGQPVPGNKQSQQNQQNQQMSDAQFQELLASIQK